MADKTDNTEQLILHAIDMWDQEMKQLFKPESGHQYSHCPKRFIYGCLCSFERQHVKETIAIMVDKGIVSKYECEDHPEDFCLKKAV